MTKVKQAQYEINCHQRRILTNKYKISYLNVDIVERAYIFCYSISFISFWSMDIIVIDMPEIHFKVKKKKKSQKVKLRNWAL